MDAEKNKKLQQYAVVLAEKAQQEEKSGKSDEAIKLYLKLVDVFLVLAAEAQDHNTWVQFIRQAEAYQTRTRTLIPKGQHDPGTTPLASNPIQNTHVSNNLQKNDASNKLSHFKKILKPFQHGEEVVPDATSNKVQPQKGQVQYDIDSQKPVTVSTTVSSSNAVSSDIYQRVLSENKILRDRISAMTKEKEEQIAAVEERKRELEEKISEMVPRADYNALQSEFDNSVPKIEYERVKAELLKSVPKSYYDDLLNKVSDMVPKQIYLEAEKRALELEARVKNSIPNKVIEDLASEVSLLGMLSEVPLEKNTENKEVEKIEN